MRPSILRAETRKEAHVPLKILLPKSSYKTEQYPLFFLAGPVQGTRDWRQEAVPLLEDAVGTGYAALPCRYKPNHPLRQREGERLESTFPRQLAWEQHYLDRAGGESGGQGCIIFWLAKEDIRFARTDGKPYAMETRAELGEWRGRLMYRKNLRVVVGAEREFPGLDEIEYNFKTRIGSYFTIHSSMADAAEEAVSICSR